MAAPRLVFDRVTKVFRTRNRSDSLRDAIPRLAGRLIGRTPPETPRHTALDGVSFELHDHEVLGILGANGAGKSTSLRLAAGVYRPDGGSVSVNGRVSALIELSAGFHPDLSGRENIDLVGALLGLSRRDIDSRVDQMVDFAGIGDFIDAPVRTYSSGMAVRLGFAVASHVPAELLLVDEVLAVGDVNFRQKCLRRMSALREQGVAILFVSHDLSIVEQFCNRIVLIHEGRSCGIGSPQEMITRYREILAERDGTDSSASQFSVRSGSREVEITDVVLDGGDDVPAGTVRHRGTLRIRMRWAAKSAVKHPCVDVGVFTVQGTLVARATATTIPGASDEWSGAGEIEVELPDLALLPGAYDLTIRARDAAGLVTYDVHHRLHQLRVTGDAPAGADGLVDLPARWTSA